MENSWDASQYCSNFQFVANYGIELMNLIQSQPHSKCLDLGCGTGMLTNLLKQNGFDVIGMDNSHEQLNLARLHYPDIEFIYGDATSFALQEKVDLVFSNAVIHWIDQQHQQQFLQCVNNALHTHGEFIFEMGGYGNNALIHHALQQNFAKRNLNYQQNFYFPKISEYASLLEQNGFLVRYAVLFDRLTELKDMNGMYDWFKMFINAPFAECDNNVRENILHDTVTQLKEKLLINGKWYVDYVRLRCRAVKTKSSQNQRNDTNEKNLCHTTHKSDF